MKLERLSLSQTNRPIDVLEYWSKDDQMLLSPPYQRGDVWGPIRRRNLIRSILLGIPIPSIVINDRFGAGWSDRISCAVIDGKQRITSILMFLHGELDVPGEWFGMPGNVIYDDLPERDRSGIRMHAIPFTEGCLKSIEEETEVFELINFGGVPQGQSD